MLVKINMDIIRNNTLRTRLKIKSLRVYRRTLDMIGNKLRRDRDKWMISMKQKLNWLEMFYKITIVIE